MARSEFRFVVDGIDLDETQKAQVAAEIQKAGLNALSTVSAKLVAPVTVGHASIKLRPEWYGLWVLDNGPAADLGTKINDIGFWLQK